VGQEVIIGFPNFAHFRARYQIFFRGKTPITPSLPYEWYETPNLHFLSISDFVEYCQKRGIKIKKASFLSGAGMVRILPNMFAETAAFLISK
jgi:methionine biosynthesis protein MetW